MKIVESMEELARLRSEGIDMEIHSGDRWSLLLLNSSYSFYEQQVDGGEIRVKPKKVKRYGRTILISDAKPFAIYGMSSKQERSDFFERHYSGCTIINNFSYEVTE